MTTNLQEACDLICSRYNKERYSVSSCFLCQVGVAGGYRGQAQHFEDLHAIRLQNFHNVPNAGAAWNALRSIVVVESHSEIPLANSLRCPVCLSSQEGWAALQAHCHAANHQLWDAAHIESLAVYEVPPDEWADETTLVEDEKDHGDADWDEQRDEEDMDGAVPFSCLYCLTSTTMTPSVVVEHMIHCHQFDIVATLSLVENVYDRIKIVNFIRYCIGRRSCPQCGQEIVDSTHITQHAHFVPLDIPMDEAWLKPQVAQDGIIPFVVELIGAVDDE